MTEAEARERAEQICMDLRDRIHLSYMQWLALVDKITAALLEASKEKPK